MNRRSFLRLLAVAPVAAPAAIVAARAEIPPRAGFAVVFDELHEHVPMGAFKQALKASELEFLSVGYRPAGSDRVLDVRRFRRDELVSLGSATVFA